MRSYAGGGVIYEIYYRERLTPRQVTLFIVNWTLLIGSLGFYLGFLLYMEMLRWMFYCESTTTVFRMLLPFKGWQYIDYFHGLDQAKSYVEKLKQLERTHYL